MSTTDDTLHLNGKIYTLDVPAHQLIEVGRSAHFVVLDRNLLVTPPDELAGTTPISTWFAGRGFHRRMTGSSPRPGVSPAA